MQYLTCCRSCLTHNPACLNSGCALRLKQVLLAVYWASQPLSGLTRPLSTAVAGGRPRRSGRRSGSRPTGSSCSCSRRPSRRPSTSRSRRTRCACRTALCLRCRTCSLGPKTPLRSAACRPASRAGPWASSCRIRGARLAR